MILLTRVDHRLLHGQVATSWVGTLGADCIFCVGDHVANDPVWKTTLKLGKPAGCKLVIKDMAHAIEAINSGVTDKYKMIICVQTIAGCPQIKSLNLGNTKESSTTKTIARQVFLEPEEEEILRELGSRGIEVEIRGLAEEPKVDALKLI